MGASTRSPRPRVRTDEAQALAHELHVHQVELETQNEELRRTQVALAAARDRFVDLYDFAPVGYLTLNPQGEVLEANLTAAELLGLPRQQLLGRRFARFVAGADAALWSRHLERTLQSGQRLQFELALRRGAGAEFPGRIDALGVAASGELGPQLRIALSDLSPHKRAESDRRFANNLTEGRESERRRVARELHEDLGQRLSALKMDLAGLRVAAGQPPRPERVGEMIELLDDVMAAVRRISTGLRPMVLDDLGLNAAIDWLARDTARRQGLAIALDLHEPKPPLDERSAVAIYRLAQELLGSIVASARVAGLQIALRQRAGELVLTFTARADAGSDAPALEASAARALGDLTLRMGARWDAQALGGGEGRRFTVRVPLQPDASGERLSLMENPA
jgi:PAS domain S-box-containing protein